MLLSNFSVKITATGQLYSNAAFDWLAARPLRIHVKKLQYANTD